MLRWPYDTVLFYLLLAEQTYQSVSITENFWNQQQIFAGERYVLLREQFLKNARVFTGLQTTCYKFVHKAQAVDKLCPHCLFPVVTSYQL
jgi:hypothetical protein